jgi:L-iditol 2-dehydrogenase
MQVLEARPGSEVLYPTERSQPVCPEDGALLRLTAVGLCGSDVEKLRLQKLKEATVLGHEVIGTLEALGSKAPPSLRLGQRVVMPHHIPCQACHYCQHQSPSMCRTFKASNFIPGGFSEIFAVSGEHLKHACFEVPSHIADREAVCIEPLACVIRAVDRVCEQAPAPNASVAVVGLGFVGLLATQVFQQKGFKTVAGLDLNAKRLHLASTLGAIHHGFQPVLAWSAEEQEKHELAWLDHLSLPVGRFDVVCLTVVSPRILEKARRLVRDGGKILLMAGPLAEDSHPSLPSSALYYREISVISSYSPSLATLRQAADWVFERKILLTPLLTHPLPFSKVQEGLDAYLSGEALKVVLSPDFLEP